MRALILIIATLSFALDPMQVLSDTAGAHRVGYLLTLVDCLPAPIKGEHRLHRTAYSASYHKGHELPYWIAYCLNRVKAGGRHEVSDTFYQDPGIPLRTKRIAQARQYGLPLGHIAPLDDFRWSTQACYEASFITNSAPMIPSFKRGVWKKLGNVVRAMVKTQGTLYVITGPVLSGDLMQVGKDRISVPKYFYKIVLDYNLPNPKAIGFVVPARASGKKLAEYVVTVDSVEALTGIDFFPDIPDEWETKVESHANPNNWQIK